MGCGAPVLSPNPRRSSLGGEDSIRRAAALSPLKTEPATPGLVPSASSSVIYEVPLRKGGSREVEGWEDLARDGPVLATQTRALPQPRVLDVRTTNCVLDRCLAGSGALGSSPTMPTHPA